jgi:hypothetical protein
MTPLSTFGGRHLKKRGEVLITLAAALAALAYALRWFADVLKSSRNAKQMDVLLVLDVEPPYDDGVVLRGKAAAIVRRLVQKKDAEIVRLRGLLDEKVHCMMRAYLSLWTLMAVTLCGRRRDREREAADGAGCSLRTCASER